MESIYAALLLHKVGGKVTEANIEKILKAAGAEVDKDQLTKIVAGLKETDIDDILKSAAVAPVMAAQVAAGGKSETKAIEKKKKETEEEGEEPTGIGSLF